MIGVVVVTYHPDESALASVGRLSSLFDKVVVVDNSPQIDLKLVALGENDGQVDVLHSGENIGIAAALNLGVNTLVSKGCEFFFLFDQDSTPTEELVSKVYQQVQTLKHNVNLAQVGPAYFDSRLKKLIPFISFKGLRLLRVPPIGHDAIPVDYLITSGSCITKEAWEAVGQMDESLFIDFVDIEWGLRAKTMGWQSFGLPSVVMQHCLGEEPVKVFGRQYPLHSPLRHYYLFRNSISLLKRAYIPVGWKLNEAYRSCLRFVVYALFTDERWHHIKMMTKGLWHGMIGKTGRLD